MHLEFTYLSDITNNPVFKSKVENVRKVLKSLDKPKGLYPNYIHPRTGKWGQRKCWHLTVIRYILLISFIFSINIHDAHNTRATYICWANLFACYLTKRIRVFQKHSISQKSNCAIVPHCLLSCKNLHLHIFTV